MRAAAGSRLPIVPEGATNRRVPSFPEVMQGHGLWPLTRRKVTTLQVNVGRHCNQACHHCHVGAGPTRTEIMSRTVAEQVIARLAQHPSIDLVDITGGAPELNPNFRWLVRKARGLGRQVIDRCNLTVLLEPGLEDLPAFLAKHRVRITASLPCYRAANVDAQRGHGVFAKSIKALTRLNALGYGAAGSGLELDLVYNPAGASLPPAQAALEVSYKDALQRLFGITFNRLLTITNMPIKRFAHQLERCGQRVDYMNLLATHFNPGTVGGLMCRSLLSVGWDGRLYDCDFNQMLELPLGAGPQTIWDLDSFAALTDEAIAVGSHCFGCTAGAGSSCEGSLA